MTKKSKIPVPPCPSDSQLDLGRFDMTRTYVLAYDINNPDVDKRVKYGGLEAHHVLPKGLRFTFDKITVRENIGEIHIEEVRYAWTAESSPPKDPRIDDRRDVWRFFKLETYVRTAFAPDGSRGESTVFVLPHPDFSPVHHAVVRQAIAALEPEEVTLESLEALANGWEVLQRLIAHGIVTEKAVRSVVTELVEDEAQDRSERIAEMERERREAREARGT